MLSYSLSYTNFLVYSQYYITQCSVPASLCPQVVLCSVGRHHSCICASLPVTCHRVTSCTLSHQGQLVRWHWQDKNMSPLALDTSKLSNLKTTSGHEELFFLYWLDKCFIITVKIGRNIYIVTYCDVLQVIYKIYLKCHLRNSSDECARQARKANLRRKFFNWIGPTGPNQS